MHTNYGVHSKTYSMRSRIKEKVSRGAKGKEARRRTRKIDKIDKKRAASQGVEGNRQEARRMNKKDR